MFNHELTILTEQYYVVPVFNFKHFEEIKVIVIADHISATDQQFNYYCSGKIFHKLYQKLGAIGISLSQVYRTSVIKEFCHLLDSHKTTLCDDKISKYIHLLQQEIALILKHFPNAKILCAGDFALQAFGINQKAVNLRGSLINNLFVTENPFVIYKQMNFINDFYHDADKFVRYVQGDFHPTETEIEIITNYEQCIEALTSLFWIPQNTFSVDIESKDESIICIGIADSINSAIVIPFIKRVEFVDETTGSISIKYDNVFSLEEEFNILQRLSQFLSQKRIIMQNGVFDAGFLLHQFNIYCNVVYDTMLAEHCINSHNRKSLGYLISKYTDNAYHKDEKLNLHTDLNAYWIYNGKDCCRTFEVYQKQKSILESNPIRENLFNLHIMKAFPHLVNVGIHGMFVDTTRMETIRQKLILDIDCVKSKLKLVLSELLLNTVTMDYIENFNFASPKQLKELFFEKLKIISKTHSTNEKTLNELLQDSKNSEKFKDFIVLLLEFRKHSKFLSTYIETKLTTDNRFLSEYSLQGTANLPGRLSSSATTWGYGGNAQNQTRSMDDLFIAPEGFEILYFDLAQAEARVVGWYANIEKWIADFELARTGGGDFCSHRSLASTMFNVPYEDVPYEDFIDDKPTIRYFAKRCRHGLNYGMEAHTLAININVPVAKANELYYAYHKTNPEIKKYHRAIDKEVMKNGKLVSLYGRELIFDDRNNYNKLSAYAFYSQSLVGDLCIEVIHKSLNDPQWPHDKARILQNVHDSVKALVKPEVRLLCANILRKYAEREFLINGRTMIIPADFKVSVADETGVHRYSTLKKFKLEKLS